MVGLLSNNFDCIAVGTNGAITAKPVKEGLKLIFHRIWLERLIPRQTAITDIILNADGKGVL